MPCVRCPVNDSHLFDERVAVFGTRQKDLQSFYQTKSICGLSAGSEEPKDRTDLWKLNFQRRKHVFIKSTEGSAQVLT